MNKEQIEKMVKVIDQAKHDMWNGIRNDICDFTHHSETIAKYLCNVGYRKQTEVAMEIFEEIEKLLFSSFTAIMPCNSRLVNLK